MYEKYKNTITTVLAVSISFSFGSAASIFLKSPIADHVAGFAKVRASSTCSGDISGFTCNTTCPTRTEFPSISATPLLTTDTSCSDITDISGLPGSVNITNGNISFNDSSCTSVNSTMDTGIGGTFTFSTWLRIKTTDSSQLFSIGDKLKVAMGQNDLKINGVPIGKLETDRWTHLVIRNNGDIDVFLKRQRFSNFTQRFSDVTAKCELNIGPNKGLSVDEELDFADARWYQDVLTDREIDFLATGTFQALETDSKCRCPDTHPTLHKNGRYGLNCVNRAGEVITRLNAGAHPSEYILDGNTNTTWVSENTRNVTLTIILPSKVQLKSLVLSGLKTGDDKISVSFNGNYFSLQQSGTRADVDFENQYSSLENRTAYKKLLVNTTLYIGLEHTAIAPFTISEIELHARCPCYGNDDTCTIESTELQYTCRCSGSSNTSGSYCESCKNEFYRLWEDNNCQYTCDCHNYGSRDNNCNKVGGQCNCKSNVDSSSRACDLCKFNTGNITSDDVKGCTACTCNPLGITTCNDDLLCTCKANVERRSGNCSHCLSNHFGIESKHGCSACNCDDIGTKEEEPRVCNVTSGQCNCKQNVEGRTCSTCKDEYFDLDKSQPFGCEACKCNFVGRVHNTCNKETGQCRCRQPVRENFDCRPANLHLEPDYGPLAGGTLITISGELLGDQSVKVWLTLSDVLDVEKNDSVLFARTNRHTTAEAVSVTIKWTKGKDQYEDENINLVFTFREDPTVTVPNQNVTTFASGGCAVDIYGENLSNVPKPELLIYTDNRNFSTQCKHAGSSKITCQTPRVVSVTPDLEVPYGVALDNVRNYNIFPTADTILRIVPDPNVTKLETREFRNSFDKYIIIKGQSLSKACRDLDVKILIDNITCNLLSRTDTEITCDPQEGFPGTSREATVLLFIGSFEAQVGKVNFISFWKTTEFYIIIGSVCGAILVVLVIILAVCICRRRRKHNMNSDKRMTSIEMTSVDPDRTRRANNYVSMEPVVDRPSPVATVAPIQTPVNHSKAFIKRLPANVARAVKTSVIDIQQLEIGRLCTQKGGLIRVINGDFGSTSSSPFAGTSLTIKTLIDPYDAVGTLPSWLTDGLLECTRLRDCYNINVLPLLGISIDDKHIYILYPEMANRCLKEYMTTSSRNFNEGKRLEICKQVAEGMNFLDVEHIVHKDLAARNCWVESNGMVKIGDASFSWDLYPDEYLLQNDRYQPVRWMAPESLRQPGFYNSKTDVWSYGVFMWEVFTNCYLPYHDIEDDTLIKDRVCEQRYRLGKPHDCSEIIYRVLELCHTDNSQNRPNFFIILNHLSEIMAGGNPTIFNINQQDIGDDEDEVDYMNYGQMGLKR